jgi:hypothetical protein
LRRWREKLFCGPFRTWRAAAEPFRGAGLFSLIEAMPLAA